MDTSELLAEIHNHINKATRIADLYEVLKFTTLQDLKKFACQQMNALNTDRIRAVHRRVLPINNVVPDVLVQQCLSFSEYPDKFVNRRVCQKWNELYKLNHVNELRIMYQSVNEKFPEPLPSGNSTWILHQARSVLNPVEERLGYKGPLLGYAQVMTSCKSGDRVLVHESVKEDSVALSNVRVDKDIHFIGLSSRNCELELQEVELFGHIIIDNMTVFPWKVRVGSDNELLCLLRGDRKLTMRNCTIMCFSCIIVESGASLEMVNCTMKPYDITDRGDCDLAIAVSPWAKRVDVLNNEIRGFKRGIAIQKYEDGMMTRRHDVVNNSALAEINISDNIFEDCSGYPLMERTLPWPQQSVMFAGKNRCTLKGNKYNDGLSDCNVLRTVCEYFHPFASALD